MNILYVSTLISPSYINRLLSNGYKPLQSIQKFNWLFVQGLICNGCKVYALSNIPTKIKREHVYIRNTKQDNDNVTFYYCPQFSINGLDIIVVFLYSFFKTLFWIAKNNRKNTIILLDTLKLSLSAGSLLASKIIRVKTIGIVTDIAGMQKSEEHNIKQIIASYFINRILSFYDSFILLTEHMNEVVNKKQKPYIIMEGLIDLETTKSKKVEINKDKKIILYAGGLYAQYGIRSLIEGFTKVEDKKIELHLYGYGDMIEEIEEYSRKDSRILYFGIAHNNEILEAEFKASLLVNPRPTTEEFTKYSFPSKNIEYMASGTPLLTTALPGMPEEYYPYIYLLEDESANGIYNKLNELLLRTSPEILKEKGCQAKEFVLQKKNNILQSRRIIDFVESTYNL